MFISNSIFYTITANIFSVIAIQFISIPKLHLRIAVYQILLVNKQLVSEFMGQMWQPLYLYLVLSHNL